MGLSRTHPRVPHVARLCAIGLTLALLLLTSPSQTSADDDEYVIPANHTTPKEPVTPKSTKKPFPNSPICDRVAWPEVPEVALIQVNDQTICTGVLVSAYTVATLYDNCMESRNYKTVNVQHMGEYTDLQDVTQRTYTRNVTDVVVLTPDETMPKPDSPKPGSPKEGTPRIALLKLGPFLGQGIVTVRSVEYNRKMLQQDRGAIMYTDLGKFTDASDLAGVDRVSVVVPLLYKYSQPEFCLYTSRLMLFNKSADINEPHFHVEWPIKKKFLPHDQGSPVLIVPEGIADPIAVFGICFESVIQSLTNSAPHLPEPDDDGMPFEYRPPGFEVELAGVLFNATHEKLVDETVSRFEKFYQVANWTEHPYVVRIRVNGTHNCTGVMVGTYVVATAYDACVNVKKFSPKVQHMIVGEDGHTESVWRDADPHSVFTVPHDDKHRVVDHSIALLHLHANLRNGPPVNATNHTVPHLSIHFTTEDMSRKKLPGRGDPTKIETIATAVTYGRVGCHDRHHKIVTFNADMVADKTRLNWYTFTRVPAMLRRGNEKCFSREDFGSPLVGGHWAHAQNYSGQLMAIYTAVGSDDRSAHATLFNAVNKSAVLERIKSWNSYPWDGTLPAKPFDFIPHLRFFIYMFLGLLSIILIVSANWIIEKCTCGFITRRRPRQPLASDVEGLLPPGSQQLPLSVITLGSHDDTEPQDGEGEMAETGF